jgi:hypothetical protein
VFLFCKRVRQYPRSSKFLYVTDTAVTASKIDSELINKPVFQEFLNVYSAEQLGNNADLIIMVARTVALTTSEAGEILLTTRS